MLEQHRSGRLRLEQQQHLRKRAEEHAQHAPEHGKQERPPERPLQIALQFPHRIIPPLPAACAARLISPAGVDDAAVERVDDEDRVRTVMPLALERPL